MRIILLIIWASIIGVGSVLQFPVVYLVWTVFFCVLIGYTRIPTRHYPVVIYGLSLGLLWSTSMLGMYVVGSDIHGELLTAKTVAESGVWNFAQAQGNMTSLPLVIISPMLQSLGLDTVWQFKLVYPAIYALIPVLVYQCGIPRFGVKISLLGALFLAAMPMLVLDMTSSVKGMVAQTGWVVVLWGLLNNTGRRRTKIVVAGLIVAVSSHYTIAGMSVLYIVGFIVLGLAWGIWRRNWKMMPLFAGMLCLLIGIVAVWYGVAGQWGEVKTVWEHGRNVAQVATGDDTLRDQYLAYANTSVPRATPQTAPPVYTNYLEQQPPLVRTALGLDFPEVTVLGKGFRVLQYLTELAILVGCVVLIKRKSEYAVFAGVALLSLVAVLFIPFLGTVGSVTRDYLFALYLLAPVAILGLLTLFGWMKKWAIAGVVAVLIGYTAYNSGIVFELTKQTDSSSVNIPYSIPVSNQRLNIAGIFTEGDRQAALYISRHNLTPLYTDYNGTVLMQGFSSEITPVQNQEYKAGSYILLTDWTVRNGKMVYGTMPGLRWTASLRQFPADSQFVYLAFVYSADNSVVVKTGEEKLESGSESKKE